MPFMAVSTSSVDGRVESIAGGAIRGWAWDEARSGARLEITVWLDGVQIAQGTADQSAPGVEEIGDGRHAFTIDVEGLDSAAASRVEVRAGTDGQLLPRASKAERRARIRRPQRRRSRRVDRGRCGGRLGMDARRSQGATSSGQCASTARGSQWARPSGRPPD